MKASRITLALITGSLSMAFAAAPALADERDASVYTSTNAAGGNAIVAFDRVPGGGLTPAGSFLTGGTGTGGGLGNQGAIALDDDRLYVVNAGSGDISVFAVRRHGLTLSQRVSSGGARPISLTVSGNVLYVLNAGSGDIAGFRIGDRGQLQAIPGSAQPLAGAGPAQVSFAPDGRTLVVTEKATNTIDTFAVGRSGRAAPAVSRPSNGATPFGFAFDRAGHAIVSEAHGGAAGASTLSSYSVVGGSFTSISAAVPDFQSAACWVAISRGGRFAYVTNTGSDNVSGYSIAPDGSVALLDPSGVTALTGDAPTDLAQAGEDNALFVLNSSDGTISSFRERADGSLTPTGTVGGLPTRATGMVAS